jgi:hypothetical protein
MPEAMFAITGPVLIIKKCHDFKALDPDQNIFQ